MNLHELHANRKKVAETWEKHHPKAVHADTQEQGTKPAEDAGHKEMDAEAMDKRARMEQ